MATNGFQGTNNAFQLTGNAFQQAANLVVVPDVVGQTQASGTTELEGDAFVVAVQTAYSQTVPAGIIISQSPVAGSSAVSGSTVTITVSLGPQTAGGISRQRRHHRLYVEIDGQQFPVNSSAEAIELLNHARALAEKKAEESAQLAEKRVRRAIKRRGIEVPKLKIETPAISVSPEIKAQAAPVIADITRLYERSAMDAEIRLLLMKQLQQDQDDEEDDLLLLL